MWRWDEKNVGVVLGKFAIYDLPLSFFKCCLHIITGNLLNVLRNPSRPDCFVRPASPAKFINSEIGLSRMHLHNRREVSDSLWPTSAEIRTLRFSLKLLQFLKERTRRYPLNCRGGIFRGFDHELWHLIVIHWNGRPGVTKNQTVWDYNHGSVQTKLVESAAGSRYVDFLLLHVALERYCFRNLLRTLRFIVMGVRRRRFDVWFTRHALLGEERESDCNCTTLLFWFLQTSYLLIRLATQLFTTRLIKEIFLLLCFIFRWI